MLDRQVVRFGAIAWAATGLVVGFASVGSINADARPLFVAACLIGPAAAWMASLAIDRRHNGHAGWLLLVSVLTPTFFAWVLNVPALLVGLLLVLAPQAVTDRSYRRPG